MSERIPENRIFKQVNRGDLSGNVNATLNADLRTNQGRFRVSPRMEVITKDNDASISNMGLPIAFVVGTPSSSPVMYAITGVATDASNGGGKVLVNTGRDFSTFANLSGASATNQPTKIHADGDAVSWLGNLYVGTWDTSSNNIARLVDTTWTASWFTGTVSGSFSGGTVTKNMCVGFNNNLYIADNHEICYVSPSGTFFDPTDAGTIDFGLSLVVTWIRSSSNRLWIGLMSTGGGVNTSGEGFVAEWDGTGTSANKIYKIDAPCALTCCVKDDVPYILDAYGILKKFNGTGFSEVARLPVANMNIEMPGIYTIYTNRRWVHHRGMEVVNGKINILVNNYVSSGVYVEEMPSGVWELTEYGDGTSTLHHKNAPCSASTDFGQQFVEGVGAIFPLKKTAGNFLAGVSYYTDGSTNRKGIFYDNIDSSTQKIGSFTTSFLVSPNVQDSFKKLYYRHFPLPTADKIIAKARTKKSSTYPILIDITWSSTTQFTTTTAGFSSAVVGDEVVVVQGVGASKSSHITAISNNGGTYTVTVDETYTSASGTAKAYVRNFKKVASNGTDNDVLSEFPLEDANHQIQTKTDLWATDDMEIHDLIVANSVHQEIE